VNKAVGHDNISTYFIFTASFVLVPFLHIFLDYSFKNGIIPNNCKIAKVLPIHKNGDVDNPNNYRSIFIIFCLKIFEKLLHKRLSNYIDKKNLVPEQYGFQKNISTTHAILDIVNGFL